ncbi:hypothetical protein AM501_23895 [Aneurinibacillus migulanus]|uniref:hypothetical protein n=1 Tax=Aneurinibacillus migulanus TaxID=47500 RepID=UPI0005BD61EA|nr:hypothetical protein [Aneurinibacillus migulanus]KIV58948.1 hypothetical protein TS64_04085 [Aneurinibacillus migulanus]KPD05820.1 hypothetical protein AM501_23895 [Aneurinibacillus migulanus]
MKRYGVVFIIVLLILICVSSLSLFAGRQPNTKAASNDSRMVVEDFLKEAKKGHIANSLLVGPALSRSQLIDKNQGTLDNYKIKERDTFEDYSTFEVWTEHKKQLAVYLYHLTNIENMGWKISLIETITPSVADKKKIDIPQSYKKLVTDFIKNSIAGQDVRQYLSYPLRSTIKATSPKMPNVNVASINMTPIGGDKGSCLVKATYVVDNKQIGVLFHVIELGETAQIAQVIPIE